MRLARVHVSIRDLFHVKLGEQNRQFSIFGQPVVVFEERRELAGCTSHDLSTGSLFESITVPSARTL